MKREPFLKVMLVIMAGLLLLNLFGHPIASVLAPKAGAGVVQRLSFRGNGVSVTCSTNGQYVYAAGSTGLFRSTDYGKPGSWEQVLE